VAGIMNLIDAKAHWKADKHQWEHGVLHIWKFTLDRPPAERLDLHCVLSNDERARADRYHFECDRNRYIAGRGALRQILSLYVSELANEIEFVYGVKGKPALPGSDLQFNMSHSGGMAVVGVTAGGAAVGIDIEQVRPVPMLEAVMNCSFSKEERNTILSLPKEDQLTAFYTCWTRKEAYVKATGDGLGMPLDRFSVSVLPGSAPRLLHVDDAPHETSRWNFHALPLMPGYLGVAVLDGAIKAVQHFIF
jgi:4'-phosphopantetheinyl transferase